jgi:arylsulfate sulfotransferase
MPKTYRPPSPVHFSRAALALLSIGTAAAAVSVPSLTPSASSPQPIGTPVTFTASASDSDPGPIRYRFRIRPAGGPYTTVRDFGPSASLVWTPADSEGSFEIEVTAKNHGTGTTAAASLPFAVTPLGDASPVVTPTAHPLVALYSAPTCPAGSTMRVRFKLPGDINWNATSLKPCTGTTTMNFYVGGMRAVSTYQMRHDIFTGARLVSGPILTFTTGPVAVTLPPLTQTKPLAAPTSTTEGVTLFGVLFGYPEFAVDASGNVIWYATVPAVYSTRPAPGGTFFMIYGFTRDLPNSGFREFDLAGNIVRETNVERMNEQLAAQGAHSVTTFHHEVRRLPNGNFLLLAMTERMIDTIDVAGDTILVLDSDMQLLWAWDSFDHLDVNRHAVLGESCQNMPVGCVLFNATTAQDWTHGNAVSPTPDGNILYSSRHQDRVYKIAYGNGSGDGHVIWMLGKDSDFTYNSTDIWPWQSHQHDAEYESANTISLFDNGNVRVGMYGGNSRGQVLQLDEVNKTVTPLINADLTSYSPALGSAQRLSNGGYAFGSGIISRSHTQSVEVAPNGSITSMLELNAIVYRVFRLRDLYSAK